MGIIVWSTESVDTSAILLAQALDAEFTKATNIEPNTALAENIADKNTVIIFYGGVNTPTDLKFNEDRMYNNPLGTKEMAKKIGVLNLLSKSNIPAVKYLAIGEDITFDTLLAKLGNNFNLVTKNGMTIVGTASNRKVYNNTHNVHYASKFINITKKIRVFFGNDGTNAKILGYTLSEKRELSFQEALVQGACEEARIHVTSLFEKQLLNADMGKGYVGWTEEASVKSPVIVASGDDVGVYEKLNTVAKNAGNKIYQSFKVDFFSIDLIADVNGDVYVSNVTSAPSLQANTVLDFTRDYFANLAKFGRGISREQLIEITKTFTDEQAALVVKLLRKNKILKVEE